MKLSDMRFYKFGLLFLNFLNIGTAVLIIAGCFLYISERKSKPEPQSPISRGVLAFFITLALFLILTAVLGCVGALKQHVKTLYVQICFYLFLISIELIVGVGATVINTWVGDSNDLRIHFYKNITLEEDIARQHAWDRLQIEGSIPPSKIPTVICPIETLGGAKNQLYTTCLNDRTYYSRSCEDALRWSKNRQERLVALYGCVLIFNKVMIVAMSVSMVRCTRRQRRQLQQNLQAHFES